MRKILAFLCALMMLLSFTACGEQPDTDGTRDPNKKPAFTFPTGKPTAPTESDDTPTEPTWVPTAPTEPAEPELGYDGSPVTITFYHTMGMALQDVLNCYIEEFNEMYPNINIVHMNIGGYDDLLGQVKIDLTIGSQPNLTFCYPEHVALYDLTGMVMPLDGLITSEALATRADGTVETMGLTDAQLEDIFPAFLEDGRQFADGNMHLLPFVRTADVLFYNKTFFDENGLSVPTTWEEMEVLCQQIRNIDPNSIPLGVDNEANLFANLCTQYGAGYLSATDEHYQFNNAVNRRFMEQLRQWYESGYLTTQSIYGGYTSTLFTTSGVRCYMSISSASGARHYACDDEVGIAPLPQVNPDDPKVVSAGPSLCLFDTGDTQENMASWLFMKFLITNTDFQAEYAMSCGYMPVLRSAVEHPVFDAYLASANGYNNLAPYAIQAGLEQLDAYFAPPAFNGRMDYKDVLRQLVVDVLTTPANGDPQKLVADLFKNVMYALY